MLLLILALLVSFDLLWRYGESAAYWLGYAHGSLKRKFS